MVDAADSALRNAQLAQAADPAAAFLDTVLDALSDGVIACSRSGVPIVVNRAARTLYETVTGSTWDDHAGRAWLDEALAAAVERESQRLGAPVGLYELTRAEIVVSGTGGEHPVYVTSRPVGRTSGPPIGAVVTLRMKLPRSGHDRRRDAGEARDPVTGLPGRTAVMRRCEVHLGDDAARPVALLLVDIDRFREVNDRNGYDVGDRLLAALSTDLVAAVGDDGWVGHLGGDQFVVLVAGPPAVPYETLALRLTEAAARPRTVDDTEIVVTATVGIALSRDRHGSAPGLVHDAATAMHHARADGGGGIATFGPAMRTDDAERALTDALHNGELVVYYQPKIDLASDRMSGVEALVRWNRPGIGLVPPNDFIPLAESSGIVVEIGRWVLRQACADAMRWHETYPDRTPLKVCVNVSAKQFETGIADVVSGALEESGVRPAMLGVEVTESTLMRDVPAARQTLDDLRGIGVQVALDDFGTGYSSLAYLRHFPVDELKIDKSFVDGLGRDTGDTALVAGIVSLAHALDLTVVAEGVETTVQLGELRRIGCEGAQGYLFSRPVPAAAIDTMLLEERAVPGRTDEPAALGSDRVVVADDAADVLMLARLSLTSAGFDVMEVSDGKAAIQAVQQTKPACVVLDVSMPEMDGLTVCRTLRADPATADCTIVMLTATDTASDKIAAFAAGADDYIVKPFSPRDLVGRLRAADRRRHGGGRR